MKIRTQGDPILKQYAVSIIKITNTEKKLVSEMWNNLRWTKGVGLAAPQVGVSKRILVMNAKKYLKKKARSYAMINPEIIESRGQISNVELCFSCPGIEVRINRAEHITVQFQDLSGSEYTKEFHGIEAIILQHEIDHLNGKLISDYQTANTDNFEKVRSPDGF